MVKKRVSKRHYVKSRRRRATEQLAQVVGVVEQDVTKQQSAGVLTEMLATSAKTSGASSATGQIDAFMRDGIDAWRNSVRRLLLTMLPLPKEGHEVPTVELTLQFTAVPLSFGKWWLTVDGAPSDVLYFRVLDLCQTAGADVVKACDCGKLFVKTGRREFCSTRCQKRVYMRVERASERKRRLEKPRGKKTRKR